MYLFQNLSFFLDVRMITDLQGTSIKERWIRKNFDTDGYFIVQLVGKIGKEIWGEDKYIKDMCLTANDASSLTIQSMYQF